MSKANLFKLTIAGLLLVLAATLVLRWRRQAAGGGDKAFFYDLSRKKLFVGSRSGIPPIRGIDDAQEDAARAVVISITGRPEDKSSWKIAYLELYSPELKRQIEAARANNAEPAMGRVAAQAHRFVRRLEDTNWFSLSSSEGDRIVSDWAAPGVNGVIPVVCTP